MCDSDAAPQSAPAPVAVYVEEFQVLHTCTSESTSSVTGIVSEAMSSVSSIHRVSESMNGIAGLESISSATGIMSESMGGAAGMMSESVGATVMESMGSAGIGHDASGIMSESMSIAAGIMSDSMGGTPGGLILAAAGPDDSDDAPIHYGADPASRGPGPGGPGGALVGVGPGPGSVHQPGLDCSAAGVDTSVADSVRTEGEMEFVMGGREGAGVKGEGRMGGGLPTDMRVLASPPLYRKGACSTARAHWGTQHTHATSLPHARVLSHTLLHARTPSHSPVRTFAGGGGRTPPPFQ